MSRIVGGIVTGLFAVVLVIAVALAVVALARPVVEQQRGAAGAPGPAPAPDAYEQLVQRLVSSPFFSPDGSFEMQSAHLFPAALPKDFSVDVPVPKGAQIVGSVARERGGKLVAIDVILDVPGNPTDIQASYEKELATRGWATPQTRAFQPGGFAAATPMLSRLYCKTTNPPWLNVTVFPVAGGPADVRLRFDLVSPAFPQSYNPCDPSRVPGAQPPFQNKLPPLRAPTGVLLRASGGGSSNDRQESTAFAKTTRSAAELESAFADQLVAAGWTRSDRGAQSVVAWSTWKIPGDGEWQGFLLVRETGAENRSLLLIAETPQSSSGGGVYFSGGSLLGKP